jgi:lambda repressor-like predicted transcriptional regulator
VATIALKPEGYAKACEARGWGSDQQAAAAVGVAGSTLRRALAGQTAPGEQLIAGLLHATGWAFSDLFTVT